MEEVPRTQFVGTWLSCVIMAALGTCCSASSIIWRKLPLQGCQAPTVTETAQASILRSAGIQTDGRDSRALNAAGAKNAGFLG